MDGFFNGFDKIDGSAIDDQIRSMQEQKDTTNKIKQSVENFAKTEGHSLVWQLRVRGMLPPKEEQAKQEKQEEQEK